MKKLLLLGLSWALLLTPTAPALAATQIFDSQGRVMANLRGKAPRIEVPLAQIPRSLQCAVIAMEDARFYAHSGVDVKGTARALFTDIFQRRKAEGGSTITQQLVKNMYLNPQKTFQRKLNEMVLAMKLEQTYSKDQILEMYLNRIYWGHGAYGAEAAAETYFGKSCRALTIPESALLAGLVQSPEGYTPYRHKALAKKRQIIVLNRMAELGYITKQDAKRFERVPLRYAGIPGESYRAPYFTSYLVSQLSKRYGGDEVLRGNMRVWTTLNLDWQEYAEGLLKKLVTRYGTRYNFDQAALIAIDPRTGYIRAMVGGSDFQKSQYNRAVSAFRQAGSTFKPFVYLTAFNQGISPEATCSDTPVGYSVNGKRWIPKNYAGERLGTVTYRKALEHSNNVIAVKLLKQVGVSRVIDTAKRLGITTNLPPIPSVGLGACEVYPIELASAYGVIANKGIRVEPLSFTRVVGSKGQTLEEHHPVGHQVMNPEAIRTLSSVLQGVILHGTGRGARIDREAAGKTGTTDDSRDAWFVGYTPQLVTAIWIGNDNNKPMSPAATGGKLCAPVWAKFMSYALKNEPKLPLLPAITPGSGVFLPSASGASSATGGLGGFGIAPKKHENPRASADADIRNIKGGEVPTGPVEVEEIRYVP